jgi:nitrate reductase gamma subunit
MWACPSLFALNSRRLRLLEILLHVGTNLLFLRHELLGLQGQNICSICNVQVMVRRTNRQCREVHTFGVALGFQIWLLSCRAVRVGRDWSRNFRRGRHVLIVLAGVWKIGVDLVLVQLAGGDGPIRWVESWGRKMIVLRWNDFSKFELLFLLHCGDGCVAAPFGSLYCFSW